MRTEVSAPRRDWLVDRDTDMAMMEAIAATQGRPPRPPLDLDDLALEYNVVERPRMIRRVGEIADEFVKFSVDPGNRVKTGYAWVDQAIKGISPGEVCVLAAGLYTGKTSIMCNVAANNPDVPILFFSLEMPDIMLLARLYAITFDTEFRSLEDRIRANDTDRGIPIRDSVRRDLQDALPKLAICGQSGLTLSGMIDAIDEYTEVFGEPPRLIMVDYLELIKLEGGGNEVSGIDGRMIGLRTLGKAKRCGVLVAHQLNREYLSMRPGQPVRMADLRYGGEAQADYLIAAYRELNNPRIQRNPLEREQARFTVHVQVLKNRSGDPQGVSEGHELSWNPLTLKVVDTVFTQTVGSPSAQQAPHSTGGVCRVEQQPLSI